jgi:hypothetical protein
MIGASVTEEDVTEMRHFLGLGLLAASLSACAQPGTGPAPSSQATPAGAPAATLGVTTVRHPLPGTKLSIDELRQQMFHVSAGRRMKPASWPNGARVAVGLSFDVDNATATLSTGNLDY